MLLSQSSQIYLIKTMIQIINQGMQIQASDSKAEYYLRRQNGMIRIGNVFFSSSKAALKKTRSLNSLAQFYSEYYVETQVPELYKKLIAEELEAENKEISENAYRHFRLELVHEYQYCFVQMTLQEKFCLKMSSFRIQLHWKNHATLSQNYFWSISFPNLKHLSISNSQVYSIDSLAYCNLPVLQKLQLHKNHITNCSVISKLSFLGLKELTLYQNPLVGLDSMRHLRAPQMKFLEIDEEVVRRNNVLRRVGNMIQVRGNLVQRVDFIMKSEFLLGLSEFRLGFRERIFCKGHQQALRQANKEMKYHTETDEMRNQNIQFGFGGMRRVVGAMPPRGQRIRRRQVQEMVDPPMRRLHNFMNFFGNGMGLE